MKSITRLFNALDAGTNTSNQTLESELFVNSEKLAALKKAFSEASSEDLRWLLEILFGRRTKRVMARNSLISWAIEFSALPAWLFDESYLLVRDLPETIALIVHGNGTYSEEPLHEFMTDLEALRTMSEDDQQLWVVEHWRTMTVDDCFVFNKLLTSSLRIQIDKGLVLRALSEALSIDTSTLAHRLMGNWTAQSLSLVDLVAADDALLSNSRPYPFCHAFPLDVLPGALGDICGWQAEWKCIGLRCQVIIRNGELFIWTDTEELVTDRFPELNGIVNNITDNDAVPDGIVLDGVVIPHNAGVPLPASELTRRMGFKSLTKTIMNKIPVAYMVHDILEHNGIDIRQQPLASRRSLLEELIPHLGDAYVLSRTVQAPDWTSLAIVHANARAMQSEGLILKRLDSKYHVGRKRGDWWKWNVRPYTVNAVLVYAQSGTGIHASTFTDYTFAVWKDYALVPIAKTSLGLSNEVVSSVDAFIRKNTLEKFGPVRTVKPQLVFELAFEGIERSSRHKSGLAVRAVRINALLVDRRTDEADTLGTLLALLQT